MIDINYIKSIIHPEVESTDRKIAPGDTLTDDIIAILREGSSDNIRKCFKPSDKNTRGVKFHINTTCLKCGNDFTANVTKDYLLNQILGKKYTRDHNKYRICGECKEKSEQKAGEKRYAEYKKQKEEATQNIIQNYLIGNEQILFNDLQYLLRDADEDKIATYIKSMNYKDFLQTPYWKAIAKYRKYRADNKCCICGSKQNLNVHHNTYEHHGYEHQYSYIMSDLTVLCNECHKRFHFKENTQPTT